MPLRDPPGVSRCVWATGEWLGPYHDTEWGVPVHDDRTHLEFLILEGAQAGLSWLTVLKRRDAYRQVFAGFDPAEVAAFSDDRLDAILEDPGIIRNRQKVASARRNAQALLEVASEFESFDRYLWRYVDRRPIINHWNRSEEIPALTPLSSELSKDLRRRGFSFVGPTVCYSHLQAAGLVNDHVTGCFRYLEVGTATRGSS